MMVAVTFGDCCRRYSQDRRNTMKAIAVTGVGKLSVVYDCPEPVIGDYDALVKIKACGFCNGTDTRIAFDQLNEAQRQVPFPTILGHEATGVIVSVGKKVRNLKVGEKHIRIRGTNAPNNKYTTNNGQMAEYGILTDYGAMREDGLPTPADAPLKPIRLPDDTDLIDAVMYITLLECLSAVKNFRIDKTTDVLVYGAGPVGLALTRFMKICGVKSVTVVDFVPERLKLARELSGADVTLDTSKQDLKAALGDKLFDRVIDAAGESSVFYDGSRRLRPYGVLCSLGVLRKTDSSIDLSLMKNNTLIHMLNFPYGKYEAFDELLGYIKSGQINPKDFYSHVMPLESAAEAMRLVLEKKVLKIILTV